MQTERPISSLPAPAGAPASLPSPAARSTSLFPGLYLQTPHSSHGRCQLLRLPHCSCHCSPLAHLSFTASGSCRHHHPPLNSSKFLPGHVQTAAAQPPTAQLPMDTRSIACPREEPCPRAKPQQIHLAAPRAPAHSTSTSTPGNSPKSTTREHCHSQGPCVEQQEGYEQGRQLSVKCCALRHRS